MCDTFAAGFVARCEDGSLVARLVPVMCMTKTCTYTVSSYGISCFQESDFVRVYGVFES